MARSDHIGSIGRGLAALIRILVWFVAALVAAGTIFALLARLGFPFELGSNFRPVYVVLASAACLTAAAFRWWRAGGVLLLLVIWNSAAIHMIPHTAPYLAAGENADTTVVWANLHHPVDDPAAVDRFVDLGVEVGADVFLAKTGPRGRARIAERLGDDYQCRSVPVPPTMWGSAAFGRGDCQSFQPLLAPDAPPNRNFPIPRLEIGGVDIRGVHVLTPTSRRFEAARNRQIAVAAEPVETPGLLIGDFNATMWSPPILRLQRQNGLRRVNCGGPYAFSWPAGQMLPPVIRIDQAFVTEGLTASCEVGPDVGSDHYPLIVRIKRSP